ncbi:MAG: Txe/YoeB family addiction module toxin [Verrucomicrobia bacterium]|nr:Txe/YoeB family addiction module toxin [Verrucomicrobiota bacterium]
MLFQKTKTHQSKFHHLLPPTFSRLRRAGPRYAGGFPLRQGLPAPPFGGQALVRLCTEWARQDAKLFEKLTRLISETTKDPFGGIGKPEPLKRDLKGHWSKRINDEHRLVYKVTEDSIIIIFCEGRYRHAPRRGVASKRRPVFSKFPVS